MQLNRFTLSPVKARRRKEYVINYLSSKGIKLTVEDLNIFIEAAVLELNLIQLPPEKALE